MYIFIYSYICCMQYVYCICSMLLYAVRAIKLIFLRFESKLKFFLLFLFKPSKNNFRLCVGIKLKYRRFYALST